MVIWPDWIHKTDPNKCNKYSAKNLKHNSGKPIENMSMELKINLLLFAYALFSLLMWT